MSLRRGRVRVASKEKAEARENQRIRCCTVGRTHSDLPHLVTGCWAKAFCERAYRRLGGWRDLAWAPKNAIGTNVTGVPIERSRVTAIVK